MAISNHDRVGKALELLKAGGAVLPGVDDSRAIAGSTRYARNQTPVNVMCDYACMESRGMGMRAHNGTAPELIAEEHRFIVRLLKAPKEKS